MTRSKMQLALWLVIVVAVLAAVGWWIYTVDPFMHYHAPDTDTYYYTLDSERNQNDGITRQFTYDAIITGSSMAESFKTSELDSLFGVTSIKTAYASGTFKEVNDRLSDALERNPDVTLVVRSLDGSYFFYDKDQLDYDEDSLPTYLYDDNPFNDVQYLFNRDVIWSHTYPMLAENEEGGFTPGITSFDDYIGWFASSSSTYGANAVLPDGVGKLTPAEAVHLTDEERETLRDSIEQNVIALAQEYPDVDFYCFFPPYSSVLFRKMVKYGTIYRYVEAEQEIAELILTETDNIHLFSFNTRTDVTANLNNYKDRKHYGAWINSLILQWMHDGKYELTEDNYLDRLDEELDTFLSFNYLSLNNQEDYEIDLYAATLYCHELGDTVIRSLLDTDISDLHLKNASIVGGQYNGWLGLQCTGTLPRVSEDEYSVEECLRDGQYVGASVDIDDISGYDYLMFSGQKLTDHGQPTVMVFDSETGEKLAELSTSYKYIDNEWHQYSLDVSDLTGPVTIILNGGYIDNTGSDASTFIFTGIVLY